MAEPDAASATTTGSRTPTATTSVTVVGVVALVVTVVLTFWTVSHRDRQLDRERTAVAAEEQVGRIAVSLAASVASIEDLAVDLCSGESAPASSPDSGCLRPDGSVADQSPAIQAVARTEAVTIARARAADGGATVLSAPIEGDRMGTAVVVPVYASVDGALSTEPPRSPSTVERRKALVGVAVGVLDVGADVDLDSPWRLTDGNAELASSGAPSGTTVKTDAALFDRRFTLTVEVPATGPSVSAWLLLFLGLASIAIVTIAIANHRRILGVRSGEKQRAQARADAVQTLAENVQHGQDLAEILPALAIHLSDELGLAGLSIALAGTDSPRHVFTHGVLPDSGVRPGANPPPGLGAGSTLAVDLHRSDRSIALLRVVAGKPLGPAEIDLVYVAGEMIASTIVAARSLEQQQEAVARLEALDELKTAFLGVASHELRTPATAISGLATVMSGRWDAFSDEERKVFAQRIATNARSLNSLVQDLLDFARLERGDFALALEPIDLSDAVARVLDRLDPVWENHDVERDIVPDVRVRGDVQAVERIVTNLVSNAVKFSPDGSTVAVGVDRGGGRARLVVDDAGPGVPDDERDRVFVRFFRGRGDAVVRTRGVGIGLSVVQDFVQQMHGTIRIETSPAGGARFVIELEELTTEHLPAAEESDVASS